MSIAKTIMIQGTGSGVGKSVLTSALCRIFVQDGYKVAPYKAQNMALNSFVTASGGEIGRAQAVQAQASRIIPTVDMNPVLIKPSSDMMAQIIVLGKPIGNRSAMGYMNNTGKLFGTVKTSLDKLRHEYDVVVMEGAGSPAEVNLRKNDIVNMRIALASHTPVILVGDIDKGGVLASIVGTLSLLNKHERKLVKGVIINKFRGDLRLFEDGVHFIEERTGIKVLGVIPYYRNIDIPEEDAIPWEKRAAASKNIRPINISVISLPHLSNFTDFDALEREPDVKLSYVRKPDELGNADAVILPGTKNTISDAAWLKSSGMSNRILLYASKNKGTVVGICGGYQMLGENIYDPGHIESKKGAAPGLSLLPVNTELKAQKQLRQVSGHDISSGAAVKGYEIHHGHTAVGKACKPAFKIDGTNTMDGAVSRDGRVWGTYVHGIFDSSSFRRNFLNGLRKRKGLKPLPASKYNNDTEFDKLADLVRNNIDIKAVYKILNGTKTTGKSREPQLV